MADRIRWNYDYYKEQEELEEKNNMKKAIMLMKRKDYGLSPDDSFDDEENDLDIANHCYNEQNHDGDGENDNDDINGTTDSISLTNDVNKKSAIEHNFNNNDDNANAIEENDDSNDTCGTDTNNKCDGSYRSLLMMNRNNISGAINKINNNNNDMCEEFVSRDALKKCTIDNNNDSSTIKQQDEFCSKRPWRKAPDNGREKKSIPCSMLQHNNNVSNNIEDDLRSCNSEINLTQDCLTLYEIVNRNSNFFDQLDFLGIVNSIKTNCNDAAMSKGQIEQDNEIREEDSDLKWLNQIASSYSKTVEQSNSEISCEPKKNVNALSIVKQQDESKNAPDDGRTNYICASLSDDDAHNNNKNSMNGIDMDDSILFLCPSDDDDDYNMHLYDSNRSMTKNGDIKRKPRIFSTLKSEQKPNMRSKRDKRIRKRDAISSKLLLSAQKEEGEQKMSSEQDKRIRKRDVIRSKLRASVQKYDDKGEQKIMSSEREKKLSCY